MRAKVLKVGQRRSWKSKTHTGRGVITGVRETLKGPYYTLRTKDHPRGEVSVRASQVW